MTSENVVPAPLLPGQDIQKVISRPHSPAIMPKETRGGFFIINRKGEKESLSFDKILARIHTLAIGLHRLIDPDLVAKRVIEGMYAGITTAELDQLSAETCAYMAAVHPDYSKLAARISIDNLHKSTSADYMEVCKQLRFYRDDQDRDCALMADDLFKFIEANICKIQSTIDYSCDKEFDFFGFKTLERSYLLRVNGKIVERPQHLLMRTSCAIHLNDIDRAMETYKYMSQRYFIHATPTLFNAGTLRPQMSSCFLLTMKEDSICGIFDTLKQCALISKTAGGVGLAVHDIRATESYIRGTNGHSNGLVPMLRVFNDTARYVDQGGGKRKGSFAIYLEPWHADIFEFLDLRKNHGKEEQRARDLFYGLWIPDLFMKRVEQDGDWTLMCPNECPGLSNCFGDEFEALYTKYEANGQGRKSVRAQQLWFHILQSQIETGTPYMLYKDACNFKSNQKNLGTIKCSNLCTEIVEYTAPDEVAVCNLASIALPAYVSENKTFDFEKLRSVAKTITRNLNNIIDRNYYPVEEAKNSNMRHRPIGLGVQGLADCFMKMGYSFDEPRARDLNKKIFETIYFGSAEMSCELAEIDGHYETFPGSPASKGQFQFDMWNQERAKKGKEPLVLSGMWDWESLRTKMVKFGLRNSLLLAPMPTASTSQILGNNEAFEPYTSNVYYRRVLSGEFFVVNPHMLKDFIDLGIWDDGLRKMLVASNGSIQNIDGIPVALKEKYRTVWEIKQKGIIEMAADRAPFICQSQSLNIHMTNPNFSKMSSMHFAGWKLGLKTGAYYIRTTAAAEPIKFSIDHSTMKAAQKSKDEANDSVKALDVPQACPMRRPGMTEEEICHACSG